MRIIGVLWILSRTSLLKKKKGGNNHQNMLHGFSFYFLLVGLKPLRLEAFEWDSYVLFTLV